MNTTAVSRVAILGAESTGKSTLAAALAAHYGTVWVPETLRDFVEAQGRTPREGEQFSIAVAQVAREEQAIGQARSFLFCDTTPLMTALYSRFYFGRIDARLEELAARHAYDYTIVTMPDSPWVPDGLMRESPQVRQTVHEQLLYMLAARATPYLLVDGNVVERVRRISAYLSAQG